MSIRNTITIVPGITQKVNISNPQTLNILRLANTSPFNVDVSGIGGQGVQHVAAGVEVLLDAKVENQGALTMIANNDYNISGSGIMVLTAYSVGEPVPPGTWPVTIPTQIVQAKVSTVNTLVNDGSSLGTQVIEMTPAGAASSTVSILNDGTIVIKGDVAGVLTTLIQTVIAAAGGASSVILGDADRTVEVLGKLLVDGLLSVIGNIIANSGMNIDTIRENGTGITAIDLSAHDGTVHFPKQLNLDGNLNFNLSAGAKIEQGGAIIIIDATNTHDTIINAPNAGGTGQVIFQKGGVNNIKIDANGINFPNGNFLPNISFFTGAATATYSHTFGSAPFWVCPMQQVAGSQTMGYDTVTATQVHITSGAGNSFKAFCG